MRDLTQRRAELVSLARTSKQDVDTANQQLAAFDTQEGQQMNKLEKLSKDTAKAWKWIQDNMESFEKEVYGPPIVSCSVKDPRYATAVEGCLGFNDFLAITVQSRADHTKLSNHLSGTMKLADITLRTCTDDSPPRPPAVDENDMRKFGFEGWALDHLDGPIPVLTMLSSTRGLHRTAVSLRDVSVQQYNMTVEDQRVSNWITGQTKSVVTRRREYAGAVSTSTTKVHPARHWTDQPVDSDEKVKVQQHLQQLQADFQQLKEENDQVKEELTKLGEKKAEIDKEIVSARWLWQLHPQSD
jgi:chromosome segregation ATPase